MNDDLAKTAAGLESIGGRCELGFVQRALGIEPLGLLRFAATPRTALIRALSIRFGGLGESLEPRASEVEWFGDWAGIEFHLAEPLSTPAANVRARRGPVLDRLALRLIEDIEAARKLLVYTAVDGISLAEAGELLDAIHAIGPASLLIVTPDRLRPGRVETLRPGLLVGHLPELATWDDAARLDNWRDLLSELPRHWRATPLDAGRLAHQAMAARAGVGWALDRMPDDAAEARGALAHAAALMDEVESALRAVG